MKAFFIKISAIAASILALASCNQKQSPDYTLVYPNALVTVKTSAEDVFYLQLDDNTTLLPVNAQKSPFGKKEVRALCNLEFLEEKADKFDRKVRLNWIDSVRTKSTVFTLGTEELDKFSYGDAPIEVYNNWVTVLEDGYLTLSFCGYWGNPYIKHSIDLVAGVDPDEPYLLDLRHNNLEDKMNSGAVKANGIIAFKLNNLPDTMGETVKLKIRYNSIYGGQRIISFDYCTGKSSGNGKAPVLSSYTRGLAVE